MSHSYTSCLIHFVFSTKGRKKLIPKDLQPRVWSDIGGIARENKMKALAVGGTDDHLHALISIPATISIAKAAQLIKAGSSKWIHDEFPAHNDFAWQEGYGAFGIGISGVDESIAYINNQDAHHSTKSFEEEFVAILERHGIEPKPHYVFG